MFARTVSPVFIGRGQERAALSEALDHAVRGEPQAVLVGGEAGVGKTRLVDEFLAEARGAGAVTAVGGCVELGADGLPFAPISTLLRALHRQLGEELTQATAGFGGELARLLPELGGHAPDPRPGREEDDRGRLFELTARLLEVLAEDRTLVLAIEDLHWSDSSTRGLLAYLFRSLQRGRLLLVTTYRSDDIHRRHPLRPFLAELDRLRSVRRLELPRFTKDEVRGQLAGIKGTEPTPDLVDEVYRRSDGNAFFVEELAGVTGDCRRPGAISDSIRDLLLVRVEALPEAAQRVVRITAEGGSKVEFGLLRAVTGLGEDELIEALRAAVGASILIAGEDDAYRFRHALVREAVDDDLLPGERTRLNRRYAEALEADPALVPGEERAARLASYWYQAHDPARALPAVLTAAREAGCRFAYAEQLRLLERALELWDDVAVDVRTGLRIAEDAESYPLCDCDDERLSYLDLLAEISLAARRAAAPERGLSVVNRALRALATLDHPLRTAWFWVQKSRLVRHLARGNGWAELGIAQELLRGMPPTPVHARVLTEAVGWSLIFEPGPQAVPLAQEAVELARLVGDEDAELNARISLCGLLADSGRGDEAVAELRDILARVAEGQLISIVSRSHVNLMSLLESIGRSEEAMVVGDEGLELARRYSLGDTRSWLYGNQADSLFSLGRWDASQEVGTAAFRTAQTPVTRAMAAQRLARLALARGDAATAAEEVARMRELYNEFDASAPQNGHPAAQCRLELAALEGRILDVREIFATVASGGLLTGTGCYTWPLVAAAATAESDARGVPASEPGAPEAIARIREYAASLPRFYPVWVAHAALVEAELRRAEGTATAADWAAAAAAFDGLTRPYPLAQVRLRWAEALVAEGDREQAAGLLATAYATAVELGARPLAEEAERLAQRARLPLTPAAAPDAGPEAFGLTPRERDVLALVAAGRSNRQIAEELFISPKTASVHVSNILAKLEVSSRGEAAALAHRLGILDPALTS